MAAIFRELVGQNAARRTRPNDDIVKLALHEVMWPTIICFGKGPSR